MLLALFINQRKKRGGGLAIVYKSHLKCQQIVRDRFSPSTFEYGSWKINKDNQSLRFELFYRLPAKTVTISKFINEFTRYIDAHSLLESNTVILGDFNIHMNDIRNTDTLDFQATMHALGFHQHVECATHNKGHILDLIFTSFHHKKTVLSVTQGPYFSDHCLLITTLGVLKTPVVTKEIQYRRLKSVDPTSFGPTLYRMLQSIDCSKSLDTIVPTNGVCYENSAWSSCSSSHRKIFSPQATDLVQPGNQATEDRSALSDNLNESGTVFPLSIHGPISRSTDQPTSMHCA